MLKNALFFIFCLLRLVRYNRFKSRILVHYTYPSPWQRLTENLLQVYPEDVKAFNKMNARNINLSFFFLRLPCFLDFVLQAFRNFEIFCERQGNRRRAEELVAIKQDDDRDKRKKREFFQAGISNLTSFTISLPRAEVFALSLSDANEEISPADLSNGRGSPEPVAPEPCKSQQETQAGNKSFLSY